MLGRRGCGGCGESVERRRVRGFSACEAHAQRAPLPLRLRVRPMGVSYVPTRKAGNQFPRKQESACEATALGGKVEHLRGVSSGVCRWQGWLVPNCCAQNAKSTSCALLSASAVLSKSVSSGTLLSLTVIATECTALLSRARCYETLRWRPHDSSLRLNMTCVSRAMFVQVPQLSPHAHATLRPCRPGPCSRQR